MQGDFSSPLISLALPLGSFHGWGICGKFLVKELSKLTKVIAITDTLKFENINDELEYRFLKSKVINQEDYQKIKQSSAVQLQNPLIQSIVGNTFVPLMPNLKGTINLGYTFFEENILSEEFINNARSYFDFIATGSSWNEKVLRNYGISNVKTVIQGIDPAFFNPYHSEKDFFTDAFVIFSGGKFELRKGQDLVIRAYKHLQDRFNDVMLINCWQNFWLDSFNTMTVSRHIRFTPSGSSDTNAINQILIDNGIDLKRVITLPTTPNVMMAKVYKNTDIGLFPNRCEGGTNLVMMEYMACGKAVIASYNTGHEDILTESNSIRLLNMSELNISRRNRLVAKWYEPSIDEIIANLEEAYYNRQALKPIAKQSARDLSKKTWQASAKGFYNIIINHN